MWTKRFGVWVRSRGHGVAQNVGEGANTALIEPSADSGSVDYPMPPEPEHDQISPPPTHPNPHDRPVHLK